MGLIIDAVLFGLILFLIYTHRRFAAENKIKTAKAETVQVEADIFFTNSLDMCAVIGPEGQFIRVSPACLSILGYSPEEFCKIPYANLIHPDDLQKTNQQAENQKAGLQVFNFENRYRTKNGNYKWLSWTYTQVGDLTYAVARDVTDQKNLASNTEQNFEAVANNMLMMAWVTDKDLNIIWGNDKWNNFFTDHPTTLLDSTWKNLIHPDDFDNYVQTVASAYMKGESYKLEYRVKGTNDENYTWMYRICSPVKNEQGEIVKWAGSCASIQDQKMQLERANLERQTLSLVVNNVEGIIWSADKNGIVTFYEGQGATKLKMKSSNIVGRSVFDLDLGTTAVADAVRRALNGEAVNSEFERDSLVFQTFIAPMRNAAGEIQGVVGYGVDVTERRRIESERNEAVLKEEQLRQSEKAALESSKLKSEFLANMSHEIRTPINGVVGMTGLLLDTSLSKQQREFADNIRICSESLLTVINDILDFSKIEAGKLQLENNEFNLGELLDDCVKTLNFSANQKSLNLKIEKSNFKTLFVGDSGRVRQVLTNLLNNAIKFTEKGSVVLKCSEVFSHDQSTLLYFEVIDTGIGISNEAMAKMFKSFSQADNSVSRKYGGTGLGLSISKKLIELMGGVIGLESKVNSGSRFWFKINLPIGENIVSNTPEVTNPFGSLELKNKKPFRILVAEDNSINQKVTLRQLEKLGYYADAVANGLEVIAALEFAPYDLILMDCQMPELDGFQATKKIRAHSSKHLNQIPIIALTANAFSTDRDQCLESGMNDYLSKPTKLEDLTKVIEMWTSEKATSSPKAV